MVRKASVPDISFLTQPALSAGPNLFAASVGEGETPLALALTALADNPFQPRDQIDPGALAELASVIAAQGFQGVLVARPHPQQAATYQLAFGHRRREAARLAGLSTLPVLVRDLTNEEMVEIAITENIQREDLSPWMEARTYGLMDQELGYTHEQIATAVGKKRGYVENRLRLLRAPADVQALVADKPDTLRAVANRLRWPIRPSARP